MGFDCQDPPFTDHNTLAEATDWGSSAIARTVMGAPAAGTAGEWVSALKVGPRFAMRVEFVLPGVPIGCDVARTVVRATWLK